MYGYGNRGGKSSLVMTFSVCKSTDPLCLCDLPLGPLNRENTERRVDVH